MDLKAAYKQLPIKPEHRKICVVTVRDPADGLPKGFPCRVLPFGATASVGHFNRTSAVLQRIMWELLLMATNYYDDYPVVEVEGLASNADSAIRAFLQYLGFVWSADKDKPFSAVADMLGVRVDSSAIGMDKVLVCNKPERSRDLADSVSRVLSSGCVEPRSIPALFGRLQFAEAQILGRQGKLAMSCLRSVEKFSHCHVLESSEVAAFEELRKRLTQGRPRELVVFSQGSIRILFTDGACEPSGGVDLASVGGVLYSCSESGVWDTRAFSAKVRNEVIARWKAAGKKHFIGPTELLAVVTARVLWARFLDGARTFVFIDHSGVLSACIKGNSRDESWRDLLLAFERADSHVPMLPWYSRVPSTSNPADAP